MSKRFRFPEQSGIRKKAKLDITVSDHNFPLSQNAAVNTETDENDTWGDEIDDEMLLLASQACEKAISGHNICELPNYSICMDPPSTSTQIQTNYSSTHGCFQFKFPSSQLQSANLNNNSERNPSLGGTSNKRNYNENVNDLISNNSYNTELPNYSMCMDPPSTSTQRQPEPSTSRDCFQFKVPSSNNFYSLSTKLNDKCEKICSPLRSMSKVCKADNVNISDDLIFNNVINRGQDSDQIYRQLMQLKEEKEKLKLENGKLLEKYVTKEGEASILRTQLKTCQMAIDNARMDKIKTQETVQMDWSEKLSVANKQLSELRTQLDFKNLEIISVKEKCKLLESNKVKLTQVKVGNESMSQSCNINKSGMNNTQLKRIKKTSTAAQTEDKSHYLKLTLGYNKDYTKLTELLPLIMDQTCEHYSILEYNEKLKQTHSYNKCHIYTTFHRLPSADVVNRNRKTYNLGNLYEDLSYISTANYCDLKKCLHIIRTVRDVLLDVCHELRCIQQRLTTAFMKEMDDVYVEMSRHMTEVCPQHLLSGKALYKEEQGLQARRVTAVLVYILEDSRYNHIHDSVLDDNKTVEEIFIDLINNICVLLDCTSLATLYSGLLLAITLLLKIFMTRNDTRTIGVIKNIILSRPMGFVICKILQQMGTYGEEQIRGMCRTGSASLKLDHEQGVLLYRRESCIIRVLLEQIEAAMICVEKQNLVTQAIQCGRSFIELYSKLNYYAEDQRDQCRCECRSVLIRVILYLMKICAQMWTDNRNSTDAKICLQAVCQCGLQVLYQTVTTDMDQVTKYEGPLVQVCHIIKDNCEEMYSNMISEIISTFQSATEESPQSYNKRAWVDSFQTFSITE